MIQDTKFADHNDSRLTKFGKFIRITALDELPQFINVFLGEMSIIGPRPHPIIIKQTIFKIEFKNLIKDISLSLV